MHIQNALIQTHFTKYSRELYKKLSSQGNNIGKCFLLGDFVI